MPLETGNDCIPNILADMDPQAFCELVEKTSQDILHPGEEIFCPFGGINHRNFYKDRHPDPSQASYIYFSAVWYCEADRGFMTPKIVHKLQEGASMLSVGCGPAHLERVLHEGFGAQNIILSDVVRHPAAEQSDMQFLKFDMSQKWPSFSQQFDYVLFPESLGVVFNTGGILPTRPSHISEDQYNNLNKFQDTISNKILAEDYNFSDNAMDVYLRSMRDFHPQLTSSGLIECLFRAAKLVKPGGRLMSTFGVPEYNQRAYIQLLLRKQFPHVVFPPARNGDFIVQF